MGHFVISVTSLLIMAAFTCAGREQADGKTVNFKVDSDVAQSKFHQLQDTKALCDVCVIFVKRLDILLHEGHTKDFINKTLYGLCDLTQEKYRETCYFAVPEIEKQFEGHLDARKTCKLLSFCTEENDLSKAIVNHFNGSTPKHYHRIKRQIGDKFLSAVRDKALSINKRVFKQQRDLVCTVCKTLVNTTENSLTPVENFIIKTVDEICGYLPDPTKKACTDTVNHYVPIWWKEFLQFATPDMVCYMLRLCDN